MNIHVVKKLKKLKQPRYDEEELPLGLGAMYNCEFILLTES